MIVSTAEELRNLTGSYYANNDFERIASTVKAVEDEVASVIGRDVMASLAEETEAAETSVELETEDGELLKVANREFTIDEEGNLVFADGYSAYGIRARVEDDTLYVSNERALEACKQAIAYMATMRYYRLNDISHENQGRKVKIDKDNEARPFEWQLARDDRAHLEEYYRAMDRLMDALQDDPRYWKTAAYKQRQRLIVSGARLLAWLTGVEESAWLYARLVPFLAESQRHVEKAYGDHLPTDDADALMPDTDTLEYAAGKAVALGAIMLMGRRTSLQMLPYGLMKLFESDGGGNRQEQGALDQLNDYLKHLSIEQQYWVNEMKHLRDKAAGVEEVQHLILPENDPRGKFMRV